MLFADAIRSTLESAGLEVVGVATTGGQGLEDVRRERPDLVLVDLGLPDQSGLAVGKQILEDFPETKVLALTAIDAPRAVEEALRSGFHGYLTKDTPVARFVTSVMAAVDGQVVIPHRLAPSVAGARSPGEESAALLVEQLTPRELEVLALLVDGSNGEDIARRLVISPNTVRTHVQSILTKLQVHSRLEAATFAVRHGVVAPPGGGAYS
jgi:two-component system, NarL family, nitrate/nitrite response regulator NarL